MDKTFKLVNIAALIEFTAGSGMAVFFHWFLDYKEAALIIFGVGALLSLATYLLKEELAKVRQALTDQFTQSHEINSALAGITEPECQAKSLEIVTGFKKTLSMLQKGYVPLSETEFYLEASMATDNAKIMVRSVDPFAPGWDTRSAMLNLYQANLRAIERGSRVLRIFVLGREEFLSPEAQKILSLQLRDGIDVRVAYREELPSAGDSAWNSPLSYNFTIYDDTLVTDAFLTPTQYFGRKTSRPAELGKYIRIFDIIELNAFRLSLEDDKLAISCPVAASMQQAPSV
jgi:hypothetical protein